MLKIWQTLHCFCKILKLTEEFSVDSVWKTLKAISKPRLNYCIFHEHSKTAIDVRCTYLYFGTPYLISAAHFREQLHNTFSF